VRLTVSARKIRRGLRVGDSVAVNGTCLTVTTVKGGRFTFDVLKETLRRTNLRGLKPGSTVNLERSLQFGKRVSGHFVTGHVDGVGRIKSWEKRGRDFYLKITGPSKVTRFIIPKGSIAVDGISLTVAEVYPKSFAVWIIPHTRQVTNLAGRAVGDVVNLEADLLGKYALKFLKAQKSNQRR
jgi:riboflavin synthase